MEATAFRVALVNLCDVQVRDATGTGDGSWTMDGHAAVTGQETVLFDHNGIRVRERIKPGAFRNVLGRVAAGDELVHLNYVHDMASAVAATDVTGIGGLELRETEQGLEFFARVDPQDPDAQRMAVKMKRGVAKQASFAFTIADGGDRMVERNESDDGNVDVLYEIGEVGNLYDVCVCPQGAYSQTSSHIRSLAAASLGRAGTDPAGLDRRISELMGVESASSAKEIEVVIVGAGDGGVARVNPRVAVAKAKARATVLNR